MSLAKLIDRLSQTFCVPQTAAPEPDPVRLATAAVLLEIAYADGEFSPVEDGDLVGYLQSAFQLDPSAARDLVKAADEIRHQTIDHFALTSFLRKNAPFEQRVEIVKTMWRLVYSDGRLTDYEEYLVRKLANLLGLEHHVMISAKLSVLHDLGLASA